MIEPEILVDVVNPPPKTKGFPLANMPFYKVKQTWKPMRKAILILLVFLLLVAYPAWADKLMEQPYREVPSVVSYPQPPAKDSTEQILDILLSQGVAGVGLIVLALWIKTTTAQARADRLRIEERVFDLVEKTNAQLAEQHSELTNIGRELERIRG
jgi:hypothetical protein